MLTVLIVDDEYIVLKGMEAMLLSQKDIDLKIFTANDAVDALKQISAITPDVIIADINMPEIDGLSMIEKLLEQHYTGKFIIVSGYEKVEYLKRAIEFQVADYLLKPINKEKLIAKLQEIDLQKSQSYETLLFRFKMCMMQNKHVHDFSLQESEIKRLFPKKYVSLCTISGVENVPQDEIENMLSVYFDKILCFYEDNQKIFLLNFDVYLDNLKIHEIWDMYYKNPSWCIGVSCTQGVSQIMEEINKSMKSTLYYQALTDMILSVLPIQGALAAETRNYFKKDTNTFSEIINASQSESHFQLYFQHLLQNTSSLPGAHTKAFVEIAVYNLAIFGMNVSPEMIRKTYKEQQRKVIDYRSFQQLLKNILSNFWFYEPNSTVEVSSYSEKIYQAMLYIQQNYTEDLSLDIVSRKVNLHPSYLSSMFKKETGMCFLQYLHYTRMKVACDLLKSHPNLSVETISKHVGYRTSTYFYKSFRTHFGVSPKQWRLNNNIKIK